MDGVTEGSRLASVERAARILVALAETGGPLTIRQLARQLELGSSTTHRILATLAAARLVDFDEASQKYALGEGILRLAAAFPDQNELVVRIRPSMEELWKATDETILVSVLSGGTRIALHQLASTQELKYTVKIGQPYPLTVGASSRVILAYASDAVVAQAIDGIDGETASAVLESLPAIRQEGYAITRGERVAGAAGIATALLGREGFEGVLSIYAPETRLDDAKTMHYLELLKRAAHRYAEANGARLLA